MIRALAYSLPLLALACAPQPVTLDRADKLCREDIGLADGVRGNVGVGVGTGGAKAKGSITVTNRVLNPQSDEEFLRECIARRMNGEPAPVTYGITVGGRT
ncbi:hypothetical protein [uncultured Litoreibacter sp.]|uniref:hypothetical protein n=1 Tax=uncultured Litoreibacter sp. TaxID=1392394 RepID=UPI00260C1994|nr:hypothetical protein [uncultured Litoreibacter sp.]